MGSIFGHKMEEEEEAEEEEEEKEEEWKDLDAVLILFNRLLLWAPKPLQTRMRKLSRAHIQTDGKIDRQKKQRRGSNWDRKKDSNGMTTIPFQAPRCRV